MKKEEIHLDDIKRILFGQAPPIFLLEVLIRTLIIYIFLLFVVRWLGKRMSGQLTIMEMAVMLTLGAIVSVAMQVPDRGILLSMLLLLCTLLFHRGLGKLGFKNVGIEKLTQGRMSLLVVDGVMQMDEMRKCRVSHQQLFAQLRGSGIYNLGKVRRVYMEACGLFSIFEAGEDKPGLAVLPPDDQQMLNIQQQANMLACINCGLVKDKTNELLPCSDCGHDEWVGAVL
jgi:uncharacterized membrane protein YcaP (DUF421 family)